MRFFPSLHYSSTGVNSLPEGSKGASSSPSQKLHAHPLAALPLHELLTQLSPHEVSFFTMLDAQLDKVESFYLAREKEMLARGHTLQIQLKELNDHRKLFLVSSFFHISDCTPMKSKKGSPYTGALEFGNNGGLPKYDWPLPSC